MTFDESRRILAFSHIPKTAGTTLHRLLQSNLGPRHMAVRHRGSRVIYTPQDLRFDLKLMPWASSIAGHALKPFVDFEELEDRLAWYTLLRDPVERFLSHYQHQYESGRPSYRLPFREWMQTHVRQNWMVRMIAGEDDVEAAKQILRDRFEFVGVVERFDESLLLFRERFGLDDFKLDYPARANRAASNSVRERVRSQWDEYEDEVREQNRLDIELYRYAKDEIWSAQVAEYGLGRLRADVEMTFRGAPDGAIGRLRRMAYRTHRTLVYKPAVRLQRAMKA